MLGVILIFFKNIILIIYIYIYIYITQVENCNFSQYGRQVQFSLNYRMLGVILIFLKNIILIKKSVY